MKSIPLDLTELSIDKHRARDRATGEFIADAALESLRGAVAEARSTAEKLAALAEAIGNDRTITPEAGAIKLRQQALKLSEKVASKLDAARVRAAREVETLTRSTETPPPPKDALAMQLESELRSRLCAMRDEDRKKFIGASFKSGDPLVMAATLRGHPALCGMSEAELAVCRERYRHSQHPAEADRIVRLMKADAATERAGQSFITMIEQAVKNPTAEQAEKNAAMAKAALEAAEVTQ